MNRFDNLQIFNNEGSFSKPFNIDKIENTKNIFLQMLINLQNLEYSSTRTFYAKDTLNFPDGESISIAVTKIKETDFVTCLINYISQDIKSYDEITPEIQTCLNFYSKIASDLGMVPTVVISDRPKRIIRE
jgi:hypothetical protein